MSDRKIDLMHQYFGKADGFCKECSNLVKHTKNRSYYKCRAYGETASDASDWRTGYRACGLYNKPYIGRRIIELARRNRSTTDQIEGQLSLFDDGGKL